MTDKKIQERSPLLQGLTVDVKLANKEYEKRRKAAIKAKKLAGDGDQTIPYNSGPFVYPRLKSIDYWNRYQTLGVADATEHIKAESNTEKKLKRKHDQTVLGTNISFDYAAQKKLGSAAIPLVAEATNQTTGPKEPDTEKARLSLSGSAEVL